MEPLTRIRDLMYQRNYRTSGHVDDRVTDGEFDYDDLEHCILSADRIYKTEHDEHDTATDGNKYTILGRDHAGHRFYTCGKIRRDHLGHYYFFITAHLAD